MHGRLTIPLGAILALVASTSWAIATPPSDGDGRYSLSPVDGGFLRLDKQTGSVSMCAQKGEAWSCAPVEDRAAAAGSAPENDTKLEIENKELKSRVKALEEALETIASPPTAPSGEPPAPKAQLPTEEEVDQAMDYVERIFKKFRDRIRKLDEPLPPKPGEPVAPDAPAKPL